MYSITASKQVYADVKAAVFKFTLSKVIANYIYRSMLLVWFCQISTDGQCVGRLSFLLILCSHTYSAGMLYLQWPILSLSSNKWTDYYWLTSCKIQGFTYVSIFLIYFWTIFLSIIPCYFCLPHYSIFLNLYYGSNFNISVILIWVSVLEISGKTLLRMR